MDRELVTVGRIVGKHGIRGTLKVLPLTDFPERFSEMEDLDLYYKDDEFCCTLSVRTIRYLPAKGQFLVDTEEVRSPEKATSLSGLFIKVPKEYRVELEKGLFWVDDLIGITVEIAGSGEVLGKIEEVLEIGDTDLYLVRDNSGNARYIPAVEQFVKSIDITAGVMKVDIIEGL